MAVDRTDLVQQVLGLRTELYRSLRPAREWLEIDLTTSQLKVLFLLYSAECASMGQLAASLAGKMLAHHPEAVEVVVRVHRFESVSMDEFRSGSRPKQTPVYEARFTREAR